jgi:hypothetical protein
MNLPTRPITSRVGVFGRRGAPALTFELGTPSASRPALDPSKLDAYARNIVVFCEVAYTLFLLFPLSDHELVVPYNALMCDIVRS